MAKLLSPQNLYSIVHKTFEFDGEYASTLGNPEMHGVWIIYGPEKHGKTKFSLKLANYLSCITKVLYVSAEEGTDSEFVKSCSEAGIKSSNSNIKFLPYTELIDLKKKLKSRRAPKIIFLDNATVYDDEFKRGGLKKFISDHPRTLIVVIAHEERKEPYTAAAKLAKKLAKIVVRVEGLTAFISGRCPGGVIAVDELKSEMFHGKIVQNER
jgi:hypothetical protein